MTTLLAFCHALGRETTVPFPSFRLTALVIAQHCKPLSGDGAYPALRTIAKKCGLSKSTVHRAVGWLTAHGWLEITPDTGFGQGWRRHRYRLAIPHAPKPKRVPPIMGHVPGGTPYTAESRGEQTIALQAWLVATYPATFNLDAPSPLKIGIHLDLLARHPDLDPATLRRALKRYCGRPRYQLALASEGAVRLDLDGQPAGEVTAEQQKVAQRKVAPKKPRQAAKSAAQATPDPAPIPTPKPVPKPPEQPPLNSPLAGRPILRLKKPSPGVVAAVVTRREVKP